jgi:acyl-CoA synthetase (AMP-forming)/AMP-acid ligase II
MAAAGADRQATLNYAVRLGDVIVRNAALFADKAALVSANGESVSFGRFAERVARLSDGLSSLGLRNASRVAILSRNRPEYLEAVCAAATGLVAVPLNWRLSEREILQILGDCRPEVLLVDRNFVESENAFREVLGPQPHFVCFDGARCRWLGYEDILSAAQLAVLDAPFDPDQTACLIYTSGTTGKPKGAELTHRGLLLNCRAAAEQLLRLTPDDVSLAPMPFFHVGGLWYHLFPSFAAGCTTVVLPAFEPAAVLASIERERVTNVHLVPTMLHGLLEAPSFRFTDVSSLRLVFYAASSIPPALLKRAMGALAGCGFVQGYGSTEAGMVTCLSEDDHRLAVQTEDEQLLSSCGRPLAGVSVRLLDVADGMGEIAVESMMTMKRYWANDDATATSFRDGLFLTGDLGSQDADDYVYLLDRKSDMIVTGGENVYPREVEEILLLDERLAEAAVFDLPDEKWVQRVVAAVVPTPGVLLDAAGLMDHARRRLAGFKCPKQIFIVASLPRNAAGKVLRKELRSVFSETSASQS